MKARRTIQWKKLIAKLVIWGTAEIVLNLLGVDQLADYSEFLSHKDTEIILLAFSRQ
ncbi:MAG: hypothetical protein Kow00121_30950 [Elainellaceae cyanobacterium]